MFHGANLYEQQFIPKPMYTQSADKQEEPAECTTCRQRIPPKCATCHQFINEPSSDEEYCEECGQELPEEEDADEREEIEQSDDCRGYKWLQGKNKTQYVAMCRACNRRAFKCPRCDQIWSPDEFDSGEDSGNADDDSEDENNEESEGAEGSEEGAEGSEEGEASEQEAEDEPREKRASRKRPYCSSTCSSDSGNEYDHRRYQKNLMK